MCNNRRIDRREKGQIEGQIKIIAVIELYYQLGILY